MPSTYPDVHIHIWRVPRRSRQRIGRVLIALRPTIDAGVSVDADRHNSADRRDQRAAHRGERAGEHLWWYVAPLSVEVVLLTVGVRGTSWFILAHCGHSGTGGLSVVALNPRVVRQDLRPKRAELNALLSDLGE